MLGQRISTEFQLQVQRSFFVVSRFCRSHTIIVWTPPSKQTIINIHGYHWVSILHTYKSYVFVAAGFNQRFVSSHLQNHEADFYGGFRRSLDYFFLVGDACQAFMIHRIPLLLMVELQERRTSELLRVSPPENAIPMILTIVTSSLVSLTWQDFKMCILSTVQKKTLPAERASTPSTQWYKKCFLKYVKPVFFCNGVKV